jgi:hypothetical protein
VAVDLDFPHSSFDTLYRWLSSEGPSPKLTLGSECSTRSLRKLRAHREGVNSDLYFGGVRARESGAEVPYQRRRDRPRSLRLRLRSLMTSAADVRVVRPGGLWAHKLLEGRSLVLPDLVATRKPAVNMDEISVMIASLNNPKLLAVLDRVSTRLESPSLCADSLSRRGLRNPQFPRNRAEWASLRKQTLALPNARR